MINDEPQQPIATLTIDQIFQQALAHHQAGQMQDAERLYRAILQNQSNHPDANHNLGVLAMQVNQPAAGLLHFKAALEANPNEGQYWLSYMDALIQTGSIDPARQLLAQGRQMKLSGEVIEALAIRLEEASGNGPNPQEINVLLALFSGGQYLEAATLAQTMTEHFPLHGFGWKMLGAAFQQKGRGADALAPLHKAVALSPGDAEAHNNLGVVLKDIGRFDDAVASYRQALQIKPDFAEAHNNLGTTFKHMDQLSEAEASYRRALQIRPDYAEVHYNLGNVLKDLGQLDDAAASYRRALEIKSDFPAARMGLGIILNTIIGANSGKAFLDEKNQNFRGVRRQYENLPFPPRDPEAERYMLIVSLPDILGKINQYCFGGNRDYSKAFRVLVAGCGTGDSVIWLAYQLKDTQAEIVAIDLSGVSLEIAQARATVRNLTNIQWVNGSLLDAPALGLGKFDYITCLGVLHHLPDPVAGLKALESVLAEGGAMAIMLYGVIGRSHVYAMQSILRQLCIGLDDPGKRLSFAQKVIANLPATNVFRMREGMGAINRHYLMDDTDFWDVLLHEQDRAYTASEVREFLASAGLSLQTFISYQAVGAITRLQYDLDLYIDDVSQKKRLKALSLAERENLAEALDGSLALHTVYATRTLQSSLDPTAPNAILSPMSHSARQIIANLNKSDQALSIILSNGLALPYKPSVVTRAFLANIDGYRSNAEIARLLGIKKGSKELNQVSQELNIPTALHWVIARTIAGSCVPPMADISKVSFPLRHYEPATLPC